MTLDTAFDVPSTSVARHVGEEMIILDLAGGRYVSLNGVGARIWDLIGEGRTLAMICSAIEEEYDVSRERVEQDVLNTAGEMASLGLITERGSA